MKKKIEKKRVIFRVISTFHLFYILLPISLRNSRKLFKVSFLLNIKLPPEECGGRLNIKIASSSFVEFLRNSTRVPRACCPQRRDGYDYHFWHAAGFDKSNSPLARG